MKRGQAMVEMSLGLLVFVTVLVFGIHFAEVSYLSIRVQQAAAYAVYDTTGQRTHEKGNKRFNLSATIPGLTSSEARKHWGDFEANTGGDWASSKVSHVFTQFDDLYSGITCRREPSIKYSTDAPGLGVLAPNPFSAGNDTGGVKCTASATVSLTPFFPQHFVDGKWSFRSANYDGASTSYKICATPRASNGNCGDFGILVGDFSLQGPPESTSYDLYSGGNNSYYDVVNDAMGITACPLSVALSLGVAFTASPGACSFAFSYKGVERNYKQNIGSVHSGASSWLTGGTNSRREINNPRTFLGVQR